MSHREKKRMIVSSLASLAHMWENTYSTVTTPLPQGHLARERSIINDFNFKMLMFKMEHKIIKKKSIISLNTIAPASAV